MRNGATELKQVIYKKGDIIETTIIDISHTGEGIGKTDAFTWFIKNTVIGDSVKALVMKTKKSYGYARLLEISRESSDRILPKCDIARKCGGCSLQEMSYESELKLKENMVYNNLIRIGGFSKEELSTKFLPIIGGKTPFRYRNKAQFPIGKNKDGKIIAGFYAGGTHSIIEVNDCVIGVKENKEILDIILEFMKSNKIEPYDEKEHKGLIRHVLIRKGFYTHELMVCLVINGITLPKNKILVDNLKKIKGVVSICLNINIEKTNVILGNEVITLYGRDYIFDNIGDIKFQISPLSFFQVNPAQTKVLYDKVMEFATLTGNETVWDLYCGIGSISLFLAKKAKKVYAIEVIERAINDARENARINNIENVEFFVGKAEEILPRIYLEYSAKKNHLDMIRPDVIVVDPPRKGCDIACLNTMLEMSPKRIVYVSCDSSTFARDLKYLCENGYTLQKVQPVDQFARTMQVEGVAELIRTTCYFSQK